MIELWIKRKWNELEMFWIWKHSYLKKCLIWSFKKKKVKNELDSALIIHLCFNSLWDSFDISWLFSYFSMDNWALMFSLRKFPCILKQQQISLWTCQSTTHTSICPINPPMQITHTPSFEKDEKCPFYLKEYIVISI